MSQNVAKRKMPKTLPDPKAIEWETFTLHGQGVGTKSLATFYKTSVRTVQRRISRVRAYFEQSGGFEAGMERLQQLVKPSFDRLETEIRGNGRYGYHGATRVLETTGFLSRRAIIDEGASLRSLSDEQLIQELLKLLGREGGATILAEVKRFAISTTKHAAPGATDSPGTASAPTGGEVTVLAAPKTTRKRPAKRVSKHRTGAVLRGRNPKRQNRSRSSKGH